jgi:hypothetical protein
MVHLSTIDAEFVKRRSPMHMVVGVAIDGSVMSEKAFEVAARLSNQKRGMYICVAFILN